MHPHHSSLLGKIATDKWALSGVLALWAVMLSIVLGCVAMYGYSVPWREDWSMVPALVGQEQNLPHWLWAQTVEHRVPFPKAVYLVLLKISGGDFRIGMIANTLMLAGLSLAMILTARRIRGEQTRLADTFFPLALLHLGHWDNMIWGWAIAFVIPAVLVCVWLLIIVRCPWPLPPKIAVTVGLITVLLPLSSAVGLIFTPFVALWLAAGAILYQRGTSPRWVVPFQSACVIISIVFACRYFVHYVPPPERLYHFDQVPPPAFLVSTLVTAVRFVGMSLGPVGAGIGRILTAESSTGGVPQSNISVVFCGVGALLWVSSMIPLRRGLGLHRIGTSEGSRFFGFLIFAAAMAALALVLAWSRSGWVPILGMPSRYALLSVPGLCAVYFAWILYGPETARNRFAIACAIAILLALPFNVQEGLEERDIYVAGMRAFEQDLAEGLSWQELADRHYKFLLEWDRDGLAERMQMLQEAKIAPFARDASRSALAERKRDHLGCAAAPDNASNMVTATLHGDDSGRRSFCFENELL